MFWCPIGAVERPGGVACYVYVYVHGEQDALGQHEAGDGDWGQSWGVSQPILQVQGTRVFSTQRQRGLIFLRT